MILETPAHTDGGLGRKSRRLRGPLVGTFCSQTYLRGKLLDEVFRIQNCPPCERALLGHRASNGFACRDSVGGGELDIERPDDRFGLKEALQAWWILWVCSPRGSFGRRLLHFYKLSPKTPSGSVSDSSTALSQSLSAS